MVFLCNKSQLDFALPQRLFELQRAVLSALMSDTMAHRVLDAMGKVDRPSEAYALSEMYARLSSDIWSELRQPAAAAVSITAPRRALQREHLNRLAAALLRPSGQLRAEAGSLLRHEAVALLGRIEARSRRSTGLDGESRAHLQESAGALRQALAARIVKGAV